MFNYKYLSQKHLKGLSKYKYSAIDTSPLSNYVMHPTWNTLVKFIPKCIAPNLITFSGFLCMVVVVGFMYWFDYGFHAVDGTGEYSGFRDGTMEYGIPNWCFGLCGVLVFLAYNLDGIDGKQARRLGVSGPLGELFDHGLDSYIVFLIPFSIISIFGRDEEYSLPCFRGFLIVVSIVLNFYISHFEKYNTGTLYLPWGYDVSMWVSSGLFIVAGLYGPSVYKCYMFGNLTFAGLFEIIVHAVGLVTTAPVVFYNIYLSVEMFNYKYLSQKHLKGLSKYKYSAIDTSPLSNYVMHPTWNTLVKFIPKCIAPNLITFSGFLCMVVVVGFMYWFDYGFHAVDGTGEYSGFRDGTMEYGIPNWCFGLCGVLVFLAYNLDGIDGKQARRLGVSGPLGELFDHGLDSYIVFLIPFSIISIFGRDEEYSLPCFRGFLIVVSIVLNFYISHFEKYNTGTLYLPWGYDVSMWVSSGLFIVAGLYGPSVYKCYMFGNLTFAGLFEIIVHAVGLVTTAPVVFYNIYLSYKNRTGRMLTFFEAIRPLVSIVATTLTVVYWALHSENDIIEYDPRSFIFLYGTMFSYIASRLIIAEMTYQRCDLVTWMFWPLLVGVITSLSVPQFEVPILYTLMMMALVFHLHYGVCVVRQICSHLKISCFTVPNDKIK